jgi:hypothetical protein
MPVSLLQQICGQRWLQSEPNADGWIVGLTDQGFLARVDVNGSIGKVAFSGKFSPTLTIERLHIGMSFEEVLAAYPTMRHIEDLVVSGLTLRRFAAFQADGTEVEVRVRDDRVLAFDISRPGAIYPSARSGVGKPPQP